MIYQSLEARILKKSSLAMRFIESLTRFFGSFTFLALNILVFSLWILINTGKIPFLPVWDPFPFVLLITIVSLEAIMLTIIVLMSQNRQSLISSLREEIDMQVNLIAEREITKILKILKKLLEEKGVKLSDEELNDMVKEIDTSYIERELEKQLIGSPPSFVSEVTKPIVKAGESVGKEVEKTLKRQI